MRLAGDAGRRELASIQTTCNLPSFSAPELAWRNRVMAFGGRLSCHLVCA